jgi:hypothetical protein
MKHAFISSIIEPGSSDLIIEDNVSNARFSSVIGWLTKV